MKGILIMSSERSGSNLLRRILGAHPDVAAPPPPHLWKHLTRLLPAYGPLDEGDHLLHVAQDAVAMTSIEGAHTSWDAVPSAEELAEAADAPTIGGVVRALYEWQAAQDGAKAWACKENDLFHHAHQVLAAVPEARFVHLCRDGRDVAASWRKAPTGFRTILQMAARWRDEQAACLRVHHDLGRRCMRLRYEELIADPEAQARRLLDFLGLPFDPAVLEFHRSGGEEAGRTALWKNISRPVMADNAGKYRNVLSTRAVRLYERVAGETLERLGYALDHGPGTVSPLRVVADLPMRRLGRGRPEAAHQARVRGLRRIYSERTGRPDAFDTM